MRTRNAQIKQNPIYFTYSFPTHDLREIAVATFLQNQFSARLLGRAVHRPRGHLVQRRLVAIDADDTRRAAPQDFTRMPRPAQRTIDVRAARLHRKRLDRFLQENWYVRHVADPSFAAARAALRFANASRKADTLS